MDPKSTSSECKLAMLGDDIPSQSSKRFQPFCNHPVRDEPSFDRQRFCRLEGTEPDQTFTGPSESLLSSPTNFKPCSEHLADQNFVGTALNLEYADLNDYLSFKNIDTPDDVRYNFNHGAPELFLHHSPDSIDRLFEYNHRRDSFSEAINTSTANAQELN